MSKGNKSQLSEEKTAGASYVLSFYQEVATITHHYANYLNIFVELKEVYDGNEEKLTSSEKEVLKNYCQTLRYYVTKTFIGYESIMLGLNEKPNNDIKIIHDMVLKQYIVKLEDIKKYVVLLNSMVMKKIIKNLMETS